MKYVVAGFLLLITTVGEAFAQDAGAPPQSGGIASFFPLIIIFVLFYFLMLRPQLKQQKKHEAQIKALSRNDKVILASGIEGVITKVDEANSRVTVKIADGVEVKVVQDGSSFRENTNRNVQDSKTPANDIKKPSSTKKKSSKKSK